MAIKGRMMMMTHKQTSAISMTTTQNTNTNTNANAPVAATTTTTTGRMLEFTPKQIALRARYADRVAQEARRI